ncbi:alpha/beta-hydrolase [Astrocystis sublimbata]|nr:alpha/beta-hydrolase [Astrocystis sublimbata]
MTASATSFLPAPSGLTSVLSERWPGASISYKQTSICETTPGVKAWSGYVSLPARLLDQLEGVENAYDANLFFWYFESRNDAAKAPTAIYTGGGPGYTSLDSQSNFPCLIDPDSNSTTVSDFSWNTHVNMLYLDQPVGTGVSYVQRRNGTLNVLTNEFTPAAHNGTMPETSAETLQGILDPRPLETTPSTTLQAARTMWQFAQVWFQEFPEHQTSNEQISLWSTSYGGFWGPAFMSHAISQNELIRNQSHPNPNATVLSLATLGIGNGCIDSRVEVEAYPQMAYNNTYGVQAYNETTFTELEGLVTTCQDRIDACRAAAATKDPFGQGTNEFVNAECLKAMDLCFQTIQGSYALSGRSSFDISQSSVVSDVNDYFNGFFNQRWVQEDLGVRVNFTADDYTMETAMLAVTGDPMIRSIASLEHVARSGVSIAMMYGDLDYRCNWMGGEKVSLAMDYPQAPSFRSAGYADLKTNSSYIGGVVRQHGNISFSRVFQAGHGVTSHQPETTYRIFERSMFGRDVATGKVKASRCYRSKGPTSSWNITRELPPPAENICYLHVAAATCTEEQIKALADGTALIEDFVVVSPKGIKVGR